MPDPDEGPLAGETEYPIFNEFARVIVRKVYTRNGERLEIRAPHFEAVARLDPLQLESLARRDTELLIQLLAAEEAGSETAVGSNEVVRHDVRPPAEDDDGRSSDASSGRQDEV